MAVDSLESKNDEAVLYLQLRKSEKAATEKMPAGDSSESECLLQKPTSKKEPFPFRVLFILGNEFCERYSFYGMRTILVLYLTYYIKWDENTSTAIYHGFNVLCYMFPLFGGILADGWWGKYKTIFWLSLVYAIGMILNALGAVNTLGNLKTHMALSCLGLIVIAIGTGGIKPCVSAFGGDQFNVDDDVNRLRFFSLFYFAINAGSLISTFVSPVIRNQVQCFGTDCYALAFGIPAILMVISLMLFVSGTRWYRRYPPTGDIFLKVAKVIGVAIKNRWRTPKSMRDKEHWLDYAETSEDRTLIRDVKYVLNVLVIFLPLPLFWTLFDQQGSRWTLQAVRMNGYVGSARILPDQMQICNPLLIIVLIPITETLLYPTLRRFNIEFRPLQRMTLGMLLAGLSFIVAALVHMKIDVHLTTIPELRTETSLRVINSADCPIMVKSPNYPNWQGGLVIDPGKKSNTSEILVSPGTYQVEYGCQNSTVINKIDVNLLAVVAYDVIVSQYNETDLKHAFFNHTTKKSDDGKALVGVMNTLNEDVVIGNSTAAKHHLISSNQKVPLKPIYRNTYNIKLYSLNSTFLAETNYSVNTGGIYTLIIRRSNYSQTNEMIIDCYTDVSPNDVNIFWMIPQYFLITLGEIFLSITGLSFAYSQAPPSMKSLLQSFWLLTVSVGNIIVLIVAETRLIHSQTDEYFLFAGLIGIASLIFMVVAYRYKYVDESEFEAKIDGGIEEEVALMED